MSVALRAQRAVYVAFIGSGFGFASWASRIPQIRDALTATPSELGLVLLAMAFGAVVAMPLAGMVVNRFGPARTVAALASLLSVGLIVLALGYQAGAVPAAIGLFLIGYGMGTWDVAMNVEGAAVEQVIGRTILPKFHAGFSIGAVAGAAAGAGCVALDVSVTAHLLVVAAINLSVVPATALRGFLPRAARPAAASDAPGEQPAHPLTAWKEPRTLLIGVFGLCMAFSEGTGNDWLALSVIDGYGAEAVAGTMTFAIFLAAMTLGRWFGPGLIDRRGRVVMVRTSALFALVGLLMVVFGQELPVAIAGAVFWGLGTALGFPVGVSAAADDPRMAAARVSVVSSIAYTAFLAGPPLIGLLGDEVGVLCALTVAAGLLGVAAMLSGVTKPLRQESGPSSASVGFARRRAEEERVDNAFPSTSDDEVGGV